MIVSPLRVFFLALSLRPTTAFSPKAPPKPPPICSNQQPPRALQGPLRCSPLPHGAAEASPAPPSNPLPLRRLGFKSCPGLLQCPLRTLKKKKEPWGLLLTTSSPYRRHFLWASQIAYWTCWVHYAKHPKYKVSMRLYSSSNNQWPQKTKKMLLR